MECYTDLGSTTGRGRDAGELGVAEQVVVLGARTLTLIHPDEHTGLVIRVRREDVRLLGGDGGVAVGQRDHDTTSSLDTERESGNIEEEQVLGLLGGVAGQSGWRQPIRVELATRAISWTLPLSILKSRSGGPRRAQGSSGRDSGTAPRNRHG